MDEEIKTEENREEKAEVKKIEIEKDLPIERDEIESRKIENSQVEEGKREESDVKEDTLRKEQVKIEKKSEDLIEERKEKVLEFLKNRTSVIIYVILAIIIIINIQIRTLPMRINSVTGKPFLWDISRNAWTLGPDLDPFFFLRYAKTIVEQGTLPVIDTMRYVPLGIETIKETVLLPYFMVFLKKFLDFFSAGVSIEYAAVILPVVASIFTAIAFFLLVRKIFEEKGPKISNIIALIATAFLITLPSLLSRTLAGIPEKESVGFTLMFFAFYFFISAWKSKNIKSSIILGFLAGLFTALMGLIWGGVMFIYVTIVIAGFIALVIGKIEKKELAVYTTWLICSAVFWLPFTLKRTPQKFLTSYTTGSAVIVLVLMIVYFVIFKTKIRNSKILQNSTLKKIPPIILTIIISAILLFIISSLVFGYEALINLISDALYSLSRPYTTRLLFTVAENKQPFFSDWKNSFGPVIGNFPIFFWIFFIGTIFLFYEMIKRLKIKEKIILTGCYIFFLLAIIFSRTSGNSVFNGSSSASSFLYISGYVIFGIGVLYVLYKKYKNKEMDILKRIRFEYLFVFALVFVGIIAARSGIRLIMVLAPIATIPLSYLIVMSVIGVIKKRKDEMVKIFFIVFAAIVVILSAYSLYYNYQVVKMSAASHIPSQYTMQWQEAMGWVRENTPEDAVFGHWWDYGYWLQTMGERATMLDGGNAFPYWNYLMGRHVLTAESEEEALELLWNHNVTHYLIDSTEIGKYSAYSSIGSDENYDRFSWIGTFILDEKQTQETKNQTILIYVGGTALDEDLIINQTNGKVLLPAQKTGIGALLTPIENIVSSDLTNQTQGAMFEQPSVVFFYNNKQYKENLRYLYFDGKLIDFGSGLEGCVWIFPRVIEQAGGMNIQPNGAALFLSPRNMRALWVKLYLLGQEENFELIHEEPSFIVRGIRSQGLQIGEFVYFRGIQGPIKIWKINYKGNENYNEEYLQTSFPERIKERYYARQ
jgi:asparagine N-glycosylation enzyme membrane subunit Stt3